MAVLCLDPLNQFLDNDGNPLAGGLLYTYDATTSDPLATFTDTDGLVEHENPIELDSDGRPPSPIFWTQGAAYNVVLKDADGVTIDDNPSFEIPEIDAEPDNNTFVDVVITYLGNPEAATQFLGGERFAHAVDFAANWGGAYGLAPVTNPTGSFVVTIKKNGSTVGTATCNTSGVWSFATSGGSTVSFAAGDYIQFFGPASADATMADFGLTLMGSLAE